MLARIGLRIGLTWVGGFVGDLLVGVLFGCLFPLGPWCFPFFLSLFYFLSVVGGSGVLSHGVVSGFFFLFLFYFLFFVDIGTFSEH